MPEPAIALTPFETATAAIEAWLDGPAASMVTRSHAPDPRRKSASWDFELPHSVHGRQRVSIYLTREFPATPPQVRVDKRLCLVMPHIEEDGRFCHGVESHPNDYIDPKGVIDAIFERLDELWTNSADPVWVAKEFERESLSYWLRFCLQQKSVRGVAGALDVRVCLTDLDGAAEGRVAAYFRNGQKARSDLIVATIGQTDPHGLAVRHDWSKGTLVRGAALFVPLPADQGWTPQDWPKTAAQLEDLVARATDYTLSVMQWVENGMQESHSFLVVLVRDTTCFGYVVYPPASRVMTATIFPVPIDRIDADWALTRDHGLDVLQARRKKRVLLLGCGSLGAPVAELLARAGIGELHLVDKEFFGSENCSRHLLGAKDIGGSKAHELARRLRQQVPGIAVKAFRDLAADWIRHRCMPGTYDLVVECTGEPPVRTALSQLREHTLGNCQVAHAWVEPFCAAAHVVLVQDRDHWPAQDPKDKVNVGEWPQDMSVKLPACSTGFHPYGAADVFQAAGFVAERLLAALDGKLQDSVVCSWVRSATFFESLGVGVKPGSRVPTAASGMDAVQLTRTLSDLLKNG